MKKIITLIIIIAVIAIGAWFVFGEGEDAVSENGVDQVSIEQSDETESTGVEKEAENSEIEDSSQGLVDDSCTFSDENLGITFPYPCEWGKLAGEVLEARDTMPYEHWGLVYADKEGRERGAGLWSGLDFNIETDSRETAYFVWEGGYQIPEYYGQDLSEMCESHDFIYPEYSPEKSGREYNVLNCEYKVNSNGVAYVEFDIQEHQPPGTVYGYSREKNSLGLGLFNIAFAEEDTWQTSMISGVILRSKSEKWPGISFSTRKFTAGSWLKQDHIYQQNEIYERGLERIRAVISQLSYIK